MNLRFSLCVVSVMAFLPAVRALSAEKVIVSVDSTKIIRRVDNRMFGINTPVWDGYLDSAMTIRILSETGIRCLRFPGGSYADTYEWSDADTDDFAAVLKSIQGTAFITVNYGSGSPELAASWVHYANVQKHYGFRYWEVGNECYGNWETDESIPPHSPITYARRFSEYYKAMKLVDPEIKIGAVVPTSTELPSTKVGVEKISCKSPIIAEWTKVLLENLKSLDCMPDFLSCHRYEQLSGDENDSSLLYAASSAKEGWSLDARELRRAVNGCFGLRSEGIELCVTEVNSVHERPGKQSTSLVNGLYLADAFGSILLTEFKSFVWWDLRNGPPQTTGNIGEGIYGWRNYGDFGIVSTTVKDAPPGYPGPNQAYPTFNVLVLLSHFVAVGDAVLLASSNNPLVAVYASSHSSNEVSILIINRSPVQSFMPDVRLSGVYKNFIPTVLFTYGKHDDHEESQPSEGMLPIIREARPPRNIEIAPYSVTVVVGRTEK